MSSELAPSDTRSRQSWTNWQCGVLDAIREDFHGVLDRIGEDDVDWPAWRPLYEQGYSPRAAVNRALLRDY